MRATSRPLIFRFPSRQPGAGEAPAGAAPCRSRSSRRVTCNLHTLYIYGQPLGVECRGRGRRATLFEGELEEFKGNMRELRSFRLMCSACGSRDWSGWLFGDAADREAFMGTGEGSMSMAL